MIKYAIKVKLENDWIYVTEGTNGDLRIKTWLNEMDAEDMAEHWRLTGKEHNVKVVTITGDQSA